MNNLFTYHSENLADDLKLDNISFYDTTIYGVSAINNPQNHTLIFCDHLSTQKYSALCQIENSIIILNNTDRNYTFNDNFVIYVDRPRKEYAILLEKILLRQSIKTRDWVYTNGAYISVDALIGLNTVIEPFVLIAENVKIGDNCIVKSGAKILKNVVIGDHCIIKENSVIGSDGFGVEKDTDNKTYKIPHVGGVTIGNYVEVGALTAIAQGTIEPTTIGDYTKIDDMVFIAHNVKISTGCLIIANSEISGSVTIGANCWIAPNACIRDGLSIGENVTIGMGSVVLKNLESNCTVIGNPAKILIQSKPNNL